MTASERFEQHLPELLAELAPARVPDYFDDLLRQTARTRQRPAWSSLGRWIPMGAIARPAPLGLPSVRQVILLVVVAALAVAASAVLFAGSRQPTVPAPFGPAANGDLLSSTTAGEITAIDVESGATRLVVGGTTHDEAPVFAPDGRSFLFSRTTGEPGIWVADADGSGARRVLGTGYVLDVIEWSQAGDRIVALGRDRSSTPVLLLIDPAGGTPTAIHPGPQFQTATLRYGRDQLVLSTEAGGHSTYWLMDLEDPANPTRLAASEFAISEPDLSPDGSQLTYSTWGEPGAGYGSSIHVLDIDAGVDRTITPDTADVTWRAPQFLPDGESVLASRQDPGTDRFAIIPVGGGPDRPIGPGVASTGVARWKSAIVSPDGASVLAISLDGGADGKVWSIDVASGTATQLPWAAPAHLSWQRVAP